MAAHVSDWIERRYGERLKIDFTLGYSVAMIRGDAWLLRIPEIFGQATIMFDRDLNKRTPNMVVNGPGLPARRLEINLLTLVKDLPQGLASLLRDDELQYLFDYFLTAYECHQLINSFGTTHDLAVAARHDLTSSARRAVAGASEHGMSRWDSLQAAEKFLKLFIADRGGKYPNTHDLKALVDLARPLGLPEPPNGLWQSIQCDAGVRYEQREHRLGDVIRAHQSAMRIGFAVTTQLWPIPIVEA